MTTLQQLEKMDKEEIRQKYENFIKKLHEWQNDPSDFEEETWPLVKDMFKREGDE
jgi:hypothetical protein